MRVGDIVKCNVDRRAPIVDMDDPSLAYVETVDGRLVEIPTGSRATILELNGNRIKLSWGNRPLGTEWFDAYFFDVVKMSPPYDIQPSRDPSRGYTFWIPRKEQIPHLKEMVENFVKKLEAARKNLKVRVGY